MGYCLMPNHVHWIVLPESPTSLARAFGRAHGRYAQYSNSVLQRTGHFWQNRFFSCALDEPHLWAALRYVERNPVRAGLRPTAQDWSWSSAAVHVGESVAPQWLDLALWRARFTPRDWQGYIAADNFAEAETMLRVNTYSGRPVGSQGFVERMEAQLGRRLRRGKSGRPRKIADATAAGCGQGILSPGG